MYQKKRPVAKPFHQEWRDDHGNAGSTAKHSGQKCVSRHILCTIDINPAEDHAAGALQKANPSGDCAQPPVFIPVDLLYAFEYTDLLHIALRGDNTLLAAKGGKEVEAHAQHCHGDDDVAVCSDIRISTRQLGKQRDDKICYRRRKGLDQGVDRQHLCALF